MSIKNKKHPLTKCTECDIYPSVLYIAQWGFDGWLHMCPGCGKRPKEGTSCYFDGAEEFCENWNKTNIKEEGKNDDN